MEVQNHFLLKYIEFCISNQKQMSSKALEIRELGQMMFMTEFEKDGYGERKGRERGGKKV